jgi:hypothetical protein
VPVKAESIRIETVRAPLIIQYGPILQSFNELPVTIGSGPDADLTLDHPSLLSRHVQVFFARGSYHIKDLTGQNLIQINHQPAASPSLLTPGDTLFLTVTGPGFQFMDGGRMMEIQVSQPEASEQETQAPKKEENHPPEKKGSFIKKLFR